MTTVQASEEDSAVHASLGATLQHIELMKRKQDQLRDLQIEAEEQFLHRVGQLYADQELSEIALARVYRTYSKLAVPGFMKRWEAAVPAKAGRMQYVLRNLQTERRHVPNMPDGTWRGTWPLPDGRKSSAAAPVPAFGTCVVYVLYDAANEPCYVGSSKNLKGRLKQHADDGKPFPCWSAYRCADREAAYRLEEKLLAEHQPYLNKKRCRLWPAASDACSRPYGTTTTTAPSRWSPGSCSCSWSRSKTSTTPALSRCGSAAGPGR